MGRRSGFIVPMDRLFSLAWIVFPRSLREVSGSLW